VHTLSLTAGESMPPSVLLSSENPEYTFQFGKNLGMLLSPGDVVALVGELGAGKTTLTQGIVLGLGVGGEHYIGSPTFTLINEYAGRMPVYHLDFYRTETPAEIVNLGLEEYLHGEGVAVIEWADKVEAFLPEEHIMITLQYIDSTVRTLEIEGIGKRYTKLIETVVREPITCETQR
jgi:tRNA threonylcarbamoyladenosine biosynthesis protein TsaE